MSAPIPMPHRSVPVDPPAVLKARPMSTCRTRLPLPRLSLAALLLCAALAPAAAKDAPEPVALDAGFKPAEQAATLLGVSDLQALKGVKRVAVPQFNVEFVTSDKVSAETSSFGMAGRSSVTGYYKLIGVAEPDFQAIAEAAHAAFLRDLKAGGLDVVPQAEIAAAPTWKKLAGAGTPLPVRGDTSVIVGPPGMAMYGMNRAMTGSSQTGLLGAVSGFGNVMGAISGATDNMTLQKELGDATLLEVTMRVHFVQLTDNNRGFFGRMDSAPSVSHRLHAVVTTAKLSMQTGAQASVLDVKRPLLLDPAAFTELRKQATTAGDVAGTVALGLLRMAIGSKDSVAWANLEAVADGPVYRERVGAGLGQVGQLFIARLAAGR